MENIILQEIYTRPDPNIPEYLEVLFLTNNGIYEVSVTSLFLKAHPDTNGYKKADITDNLKAKYGSLKITESRITYDNDKYFLIANKFILVLGYQLNSNSDRNIQCFWAIEDIFDSNKTEYDEFKLLDKLNFPN